MRHLEDFTITEVLNYLTDEMGMEFGVSKKLAKKLIINAIAYNVVVEEIRNQISFLLEDEEEEEKR